MSDGGPGLPPVNSGNGGLGDGRHVSLRATAAREVVPQGVQLLETSVHEPSVCASGASPTRREAIAARNGWQAARTGWHGTAGFPTVGCAGHQRVLPGAGRRMLSKEMLAGR
jgi:hypothetical protein